MAAEIYNCVRDSQPYAAFLSPETALSGLFSALRFRKYGHLIFLAQYTRENAKNQYMRYCACVGILCRYAIALYDSTGTYELLRRIYETLPGGLADIS